MMEEDCRSANDLKGALYYSNLRMKQVKPGTHEYAIVAYYRAVICKHFNKDEDAIYYFLASALCDVRTAVMDQGSMWELANLLNQNQKEFAHTYAYIKFAWNAARISIPLFEVAKSCRCSLPLRVLIRRKLRRVTGSLN